MRRECPCGCGRTYENADLSDVDRWIADHPEPVYWPGTDHEIKLTLRARPIEVEQ